MSNIKIFYKKNTKSLIFIIMLFILSLYSGFHYYSVGQEVASAKKLQQEHFKLRLDLANNLQNHCDVFKNPQWLSAVNLALKSENVKVELIKKPVIDIDLLSFDKIYFRIFSLNPKSIDFISSGYLVTHNSSQNCYGII